MTRAGAPHFVSEFSSTHMSSLLALLMLIVGLAACTQSSNSELPALGVRGAEHDAERSNYGYRELEGNAAFDPTRWKPLPLPDDDTPLPSSIVFGLTPFYSEDVQRAFFEHLRTYLEEETGVAVAIEQAQNYRDCVDAFIDGRYAVTQLSALGYLEASRRMPALKPIALSVSQGSTSYASYLVTTRDAPIKEVEDARGQRIGLVDRFSSSGYLLPRAWLDRRGLDLEADFDAVFYGRHDDVLRALLKGEITLAALSSDTLVTSRVIGVGGPIRIIAKTGRVPYDVIVVHSNVPSRLAHALESAFLRLSIHTPRGRRVLENGVLLSGFMPMPKGVYDEIRTIAEEFK